MGVVQRELICVVNHVAGFLCDPFEKTLVANLLVICLIARFAQSKNLLITFLELVLIEVQ